MYLMLDPASGDTWDLLQTYNWKIWSFLFALYWLLQISSRVHQKPVQNLACTSSLHSPRLYWNDKIGFQANNQLDTCPALYCLRGFALPAKYSGNSHYWQISWMDHNIPRLEDLKSICEFLQASLNKMPAVLRSVQSYDMHEQSSTWQALWRSDLLCAYFLHICSMSYALQWTTSALLDRC